MKKITIVDINLTCKYARLASVLRYASPELADLIRSAPITNSKNYITVDVKLQDLKVGQYTCIPGWHSDSIADKDPIHHIYVIGENTTEFKGIGKIPQNSWYTYGLDLHRGPRVVVDETRILVRLTESDIIKGNSKLIRRY